MTALRVAQVVEDLNIGGLERIIATIATGLNKDMYSQRVICLKEGGPIADELISSGVEVQVLGMSGSRDIRTVMRLRALLKKEAISLIHTHGYTAATYGRLSAISAGVPIRISHLHSTYTQYTAKQVFIERLLAGGTDKFLCCSGAVADFAHSVLKVHPDKIAIIHNGIDVEKFASAASREVAKDGLYVGCIAGLSPHKGHRYLLEAAQRVREHFPHRVTFMIVGEGSIRGELEAYARELGIDDRVMFQGLVSDAVTVMPLFDLVVLPSSEREGLGIALLEAMAAGKPVVGTAIGGITEVIRDRQNGLIVPPRDPAALAQAIIEVLGDREKSTAMGRAGQQMVREKFTAGGMIRQIEALYADCARKRMRHAEA